MNNVDGSVTPAARLIRDMEESARAYRRARKDSARAEAFTLWRNALRDLAKIQAIPGGKATTASAASSGS